MVGQTLEIMVVLEDLVAAALVDLAPQEMLQLQTQVVAVVVLVQGLVSVILEVLAVQVLC